MKFPGLIDVAAERAKFDEIQTDLLDLADWVDRRTGTTDAGDLLRDTAVDIASDFARWAAQAELAHTTN